MILNRYFIHLGFNGTHYHGWQIQPNSITIQEILEKALTVVLNETIQTTGCGRTDAGVHALHFYTHFDHPDPRLHENSLLLHQLNGLVPKDLVIYKIYKVPPEAHARFDAISRTYLYRITQIKNPFTIEFSTYFPHPLKLDLMNQACDLIKQCTDFTSFTKLHSDAKTGYCRVIEAQWHYRDHEIQFIISADRFLRNMVRAIVGSMLDVGRGKISRQHLQTVIEKKDRSAAGISVPAKGLHLIDIKYPDRFGLEGHLYH